MALVAGDVKLDQSLSDPLESIRGKRTKSLQDVLGRVQNRSTQSAMASGRPVGLPDSYAEQEIGASGEMAGRGIDDALLGVLGQGSLNETRAVRDHQRRLALAKEIGGLNKPSTLQEILGGIGLAGQAIPDIMSGIQSSKRRRQPSVQDFQIPQDFYMSGTSPDIEFGGLL